MSTSRRGQQILLVFLCGFMMSQFACRSRSKSAKVDLESLKLIVALKNIEEVHQSKLLGLVYEIKCGTTDGWSPGMLSDEAKQEVNFSLKEIKIGDECDLRIMDQSSNSEFEFFDGDRVLYVSSDRFEIGTRIGGQLWSEALLKRSYRLKTTTAEVSIPVLFKNGQPTDLDKLVAELKCSPEFESLSIGLKQAAGAKKGVFVFGTGVKDATEFKCRQIQISNPNAKKQLFYGDLNATFKTAKDKPVAVDEVEVVLVEVTSTSGVVIVTTPGDACKAGEVFDLETRTCKPPKIQ